MSPAHLPKAIGGASIHLLERFVLAFRVGFSGDKSISAARARYGQAVKDLLSVFVGLRSHIRRPLLYQAGAGAPPPCIVQHNSIP